jgi:hypothetical protein
MSAVLILGMRLLSNLQWLFSNELFTFFLLWLLFILVVILR